MQIPLKNPWKTDPSFNAIYQSLCIISVFVYRVPPKSRWKIIFRRVLTNPIFRCHIQICLLLYSGKTLLSHSIPIPIVFEFPWCQCAHDIPNLRNLLVSRCLFFCLTKELGARPPLRLHGGDVQRGRLGGPLQLWISPAKMWLFVPKLWDTG